jgi:muramoyltetrapeptide carboxypeptidase
VHGPVITQLASLPEEDRTALFDLLEGRGAERLRSLRRLCGPEDAVVEGPLLGGNLTLLAHLVGSPHLPDLEGAILLLEEVDEAPYRIDRMLTQLLASSSFPRAAGVVLGDFVRCEGHAGFPPEHASAELVAAERLGPLGIPVLAGAPVGHGERNRALPLGLRTRLDSAARELSFLELRRACLDTDDGGAARDV